MNKNFSNYTDGENGQSPLTLWHQLLLVFLGLMVVFGSGLSSGEGAMAMRGGNKSFSKFNRSLFQYNTNRSYIQPVINDSQQSTAVVSTDASAVADAALAEPVSSSLATEPVSVTPDQPVVTEPAPEAPAQSATCEMPVYSGSASSSDVNIAKVNSYKALTGVDTAKKVVYFMPMPTTVAEADALAADTVVKLRNISNAGMTPVVYMEPTRIAGGQVALTQIAAGQYQSALVRMFDRVKVAGITSAQMGTWIAYPEINTPAWDRTGFQPAMFGAMINGFASALHSSFSGAKAGILLDGFSYSVSAMTWDNGLAVSWMPYLEKISAGSVDTVGLQAYWLPSGDFASLFAVITGSTYVMDTNLVKEAVGKLGASDVLIQTGTPKTVNVTWLNKVTTVDAATRSGVLASIASGAIALEDSNLAVTVSLFTENKYSTEGKDWSYRAEDKTGLLNFSDLLWCGGVDLAVF